MKRHTILGTCGLVLAASAWLAASLSLSESRDPAAATASSGTRALIVQAESSEAARRAVERAGGELRFNNGSASENQWVRREADLSGFTNAVLSFDYRTSALDHSWYEVAVEVYYEGGWYAMLEQFSLPRLAAGSKSLRHLGLHLRRHRGPDPRTLRLLRRR